MKYLNAVRPLVGEACREIGAWARKRRAHPVVRRYLWLQWGRLRFALFWLFGALLPRLVRHRLIAHLVRRSGLFDAEYYLRVNPDVAVAGQDPLGHYVRYGDREGRCPMPLFDPRYYRARAGRSSHLVNSLIHYAWIGRYRGLSPSAWFDAQYYLQHNRDVGLQCLDPLQHYLRWGGVEGRSPNSSFDGSYYLRAYPDVQTARINPLLHYIEYGRLEGRATRLIETDAGEDPDSREQETLSAVVDDVRQPGAWDELERELNSNLGEPVVAVVIPVYRDRKLTWRCLFSVLAAPCETSFRIVVIDDKSPEPELSADLATMASRGWIELLCNERNLGFVASVNRGIQAAAGLDVVLLNADTEVYPGWLDRLRQAAWRHPRRASVTPFSNNATIASYPRFLHDNPYPLELPYADLDSLAARVNANKEIEVPTGIGFCMYLRSDAIAELGLFDEQTFGRGYGEENDWCQRAIARGWNNIIASDVFVRHFGSASFMGEKNQRVSQAMEILASKHPSYHRQVQDFVRQDAVRESRECLDWARLEFQARNENVLIVCHNRGGGAERHVREDTRRLLSAGVGVFYLRPVRDWPGRVRFAHPSCRQLLQSPTYAIADTEALSIALRRLRITRIHTHGLIDFAADAPHQLLALIRALGIPLWVDIHDYKKICPRINLVDRNGRYCGEPENAAGCDACLIHEGNDFGARSIRDWRAMHGELLRSAEKIWVPDQDVADRLGRYFPEIAFTVSPHEEIDPARTRRCSVPPAPDERLRIAVIGAIGKIKGYDVLLACARDADKRKLPIDFLVLGYSMDDAILEAAGVELTGRYREEEAAEKLALLRPHAVWLPSLWPETYSYTLSIALTCGYPVFAFDIGAIARRLREIGYADTLMPMALLNSPEKINAFLLKTGRETNC